MSKSTTRPERRTVEVVEASYQPSKAELEQEIDFSDLEGMSLEDVAREMLRPTNVRHVKRPPVR